MSEQDVRDGRMADLDALEAGPELLTALDALSPDTLIGEDLAAYVRASARLANHGTARLLDGMHHLGRAQEGRSERHAGLDEYSGDEVAVALGWSRSMACRKLDLADDLAVRLPAVGEALWEGWLDEPKATRLCEWTRDLCDDHARHVAQELLPEAPELPVGELIRRIEQTGAAIDPEWAARREARAAKNLRVMLTANPSGTATFAVCDTTAPRGLAMRDRCDAIAAAVRALGVRIPIKDLRGEVAARLLDGSTAGLTDQQIVCLLAAEYHAAGQPPEDSRDEGSGDDPDGDDSSGPRDDGPRDNGPADPGPGDEPSNDDGPDDGDRSDGSTPPEDRDRAAGTGEDPVGPAGQGVLDLPGMPLPEESGESDESDESDEPPVPDSPTEITGPDPGPGVPRNGTSELRLRLTTALGLDQLPATVPGYGTVLAHHARTLLTDARYGEWRIVLTTPDGHLQHVLLARHRPARPHGRHEPRGPGQRRAIVELQVPTTLLAALDPEAHPAWTAVLRELQARLGELEHPGPPRESLAERWRRRPSAEVDRWTRVRDRHCIIPCCHRPAHRAELDHTRDWAHHGPSAHGNLGVLDKHHHRAKHHGGWQITQPAPGHFTIRTRAGQRLTTTPKKILEHLPEPRPARRPRPLPDDGRPTHPDRTDDDSTDDLAAAEDAHWRERFLRRTGGTVRGKRIPAERTTPATPPAVHDPDDPPPF
ncbi:HNH endonuclease signature motif containing protein [Actinomycetospora aeridis]|uniref:DUF222 domain-containing protein n=1 Tax=Actinomycetospora aeridis TaxID=3129231 RepID=A0ABU8NA04_9PSEU